LDISTKFHNGPHPVTPFYATITQHAAHSIATPAERQPYRAHTDLCPRQTHMTLNRMYALPTVSSVLDKLHVQYTNAHVSCGNHANDSFVPHARTPTHASATCVPQVRGSLYQQMTNPCVAPCIAPPRSAQDDKTLSCSAHAAQIPWCGRVRASCRFSARLVPRASHQQIEQWTGKLT